MDDLAYARDRVADLGATFSLTFVKAVGEREALLRLGACPDTVAVRGPGALDGHAAVLTLGKWALVIEPGGDSGGDHVLLEAASRGTEAMSVLRDDQATPRFTYALDGATAVAFDPAYPSAELTWGTQPDLLSHVMRAIGLREPDGEHDETWRDAEAKALVLAQRLTNAPVPADPLGVPRLSAHLEPWFIGGVRPGDLLRPDRTVRAVLASVPAERKRAIAVAQVRALAARLGIAGTPGLGAALERAGDSGGPGAVAVDSELGRAVRGWLADRATYGAFTSALRGVLDPDPDVAVRAALRPLSGAEVAAVVAGLS
ncbi:DUF6461 domain-containing protein [Actinoplanes sp. NPDC051494]|uniref:DUF6461 domain-containing protein n=1 Tax=Actinoplanes sp. NPDC051494 TaxID=3363907 RepID=UPI0037B1763A